MRGRFTLHQFFDLGEADAIPDAIERERTVTLHAAAGEASPTHVTVRIRVVPEVPAAALEEALV